MTLRALRKCPSGDGLRICLPPKPAHAVRVRVVPFGTGVLGYVLGWADSER